MTDIDDLLSRLRRAGQHPSRSLLKKVRAVGPSMVPALIEMATDERLHHADQDSPEVWAPLHAIEVLGELRAAEAVEPLLALMPWDDDWLAKALPHYFGQIGKPALEPLRRLLFEPEHDLWTPVRAAASLGEIAEHHPELRDEVVATLAARLDPSETRKPDDETVNAYVVSELCDLHAAEAGDAVRRAYADDRVNGRIIGPDSVEEELDLSLDLPADGAEKTGLHLWLHCTACDYERPHTIERVYLDLETLQEDQPEEKDKYVIPQTITCPKCGAVDQYELTSEAYLALMAATLRPALGITLGDERDETTENALVIAPYGMKDGRPVDMQEARERYQRQVTAEPSRADLRLRYANVLRGLDERDEAASEYRAALRLDSANVEACLKLGELAQEDGDLSRARRFFERVLELAPKRGLPLQLWGRYTESARAALAEIDAPVGLPAAIGSISDTPALAPLSPVVEPFVRQEPLIRGPKVGRNEPCPCGSDRKYKRCCGR